MHVLTTYMHNFLWLQDCFSHANETASDAMYIHTSYISLPTQLHTQWHQHKIILIIVAWWPLNSPLLPHSYLGWKFLAGLLWFVFRSSPLSIHPAPWGSVWRILSFHSAHTAPSVGYWWTWSSRGHPCALYLPPWQRSCTDQSLRPHELIWVPSCSQVPTPWAWIDYRRQQWRRWT